MPERPSQFEAETRIKQTAANAYQTYLHAAWSIGTNPNGGYALTPLLRALLDVSEQPDPLTLTTHFLRPALGDTEATIEAVPVRLGNTVSTVRGDLIQGGKPRLTMLASFGRLEPHADEDARHTGATNRDDPQPEVEKVEEKVETADGNDDRRIVTRPPDIPPIDQCVHRSALEQGVEVPLLTRADVYLAPQYAEPEPNRDALIEGWVRLADGSRPSLLTLPVCADAFPPSPIAKLRNIGWVPTIELTMHTRRRPTSAWLRGRFHCDDLRDGRMVESGTLWDASGQVVARSRQIGLVVKR